MSSPKSLPFPKVRGAATDGRLLNVYFRQEQLKNLHSGFAKKTAAIRDALVKDTGVSATEATIEYSLALSAIKQHYESLDANKELEAEYRIAKGQDAADRRESSGIVYIEPDLRHTPFYSVVVPLSAAIAAGNCIVLRLDNTLKSLPTTLRNLLTTSLDRDILEFTQSTPSDSFLSETNPIQVLQQSSDVQPSFSRLVSRASGRVIAVVDRSADLDQAANALVTARFAFGGTSVYAPDLVLVNEYERKEFVEKVLQRTIKFLSGSSGPNGFANGDVKPKKSEKSVKNALDKIQNQGDVRIITSGDGGAVVEVLNRTSPVLSQKLSHPILTIHTVTSLEDAIDLSNTDTNTTPLLAAYHFSNPQTAKYTSQFIRSSVSFCNHIPIPLLIGPASPTHHPFSLSPRYHPSLFTLPSPQYIQLSEQSSKLAESLKGGDATAVQELVRDATSELKVAKRPDNIAIGFFEQGIFIGLGMVGLPVLTAVVGGVGLGARYAWLRWR